MLCFAHPRRGFPLAGKSHQWDDKRLEEDKMSVIATPFWTSFWLFQPGPSGKERQNTQILNAESKLYLVANDMTVYIKKSKDEIKHSIYKTTMKHETEQKAKPIRYCWKKSKAWIERYVPELGSMKLKRTTFFRFVYTFHTIPMQVPLWVYVHWKDGPKFTWNRKSPGIAKIALNV